MDRAGSEADGALGVTAGFDAGFHCGLHISGVVQRVEDTDHVDAVIYRLLHKTTDGIIGIVMIA